MSEFKFACPVCGQHISADSSASGTQLDCPTCFRRIVVPQAPASDSKLILSAVQPPKGRPAAAGAGDLGPLRKRRSGISLAGAALLLLFAGGAYAIYHFRPQLHETIKRASNQFKMSSNTAPEAALPEAAVAPSGMRWTLDLKQAAIPEQVAAGSIHGQPFVCAQATLTGGAFSLRQGRGWPPDLAVAVVLPVQKGEDLSGRTIQIASDKSPPVPRVILRWKNEQQQEQREEITSGYALKLIFGQAATGRVSGKIFIALPDANKSVVAGLFDAEIKPAKPKK